MAPPTIPFSELPQNAKSQFLEFYNMIKGVQRKADLLSSSSTGKSLERISRTIEDLSAKLQSVSAQCGRESSNVSALLEQVRRQFIHTEAAIRDCERLAAGVSVPSELLADRFPSPYFLELEAAFARRMSTFQSRIVEVEHHIESIMGERGAAFSPETLENILRHQYDAFMALATKVASLHEATEEERAMFLRYRARILGQSDDPFVAADKREEERLRRTNARTKGSQAPNPVFPSAVQGGGQGGGQLFASTGQPAGSPSAGIFGNPGASPAVGMGAPAAFATRFGATAPAASSGGLFGASTPAAGGGLFGASTPAAGGGGLFGASTPAAGGGGLFGASTPAAGGGGLFGASTPAAGTGGGLFGASAPAAGTGGGGLFGASAPAAGTGGGLFGATTPAAGTGGGGMFGASAPAASGGAGGSLFGTSGAAGTTGGYSFGR